MATIDLGKVVPEKGVDYFTSSDKQEMVNDVLGEITIPTKVSDLTNDSEFIDKDANNLTYYYKKTEIDSSLGNYQSKIDSSHKLSSDLVDDTNNTNKFVSAAEKSTWNGKANASDVYSKTDSDNRYLQSSKIVVLTQVEYDALQTIDSTVFYMIKEV